MTPRRVFAKGIPGLWLGILFFCPSPAPLGAASLVRELIDERQWPAVLVESRRTLASDPTNETALLGEALASLFMTSPRPHGRMARASLESLHRLAIGAQAPDIRAMAAYEAGVRAQLAGDPVQARTHLRLAFLAGGPGDLALKSACRLAALEDDGPPMDTALRQQVRTCADQGGRAIRQACADEDRARQPRSAASLAGLPIRAIVAFYRTAVAPAIGARCSLTPGCSSYFLEAGRKHGLLAFPMIADRLVREPSVVSEAAQPVDDGHSLRYADPVEAHDYWW